MTRRLANAERIVRNRCVRIEAEEAARLAEVEEVAVGIRICVGRGSESSSAAYPH